MEGWEPISLRCCWKPKLNELSWAQQSHTVQAWHSCRRMPASHLCYPRVTRRFVQGHFLWQWYTEERPGAPPPKPPVCLQASLLLLADFCLVWPMGEEILLNCSYITGGCTKATCNKVWAFLIKLKKGLQALSHVERHSLHLFTP